MANGALPAFDMLVGAYPSPLRIKTVELKTLIGGAVNDVDAPPAQQWLGGAHGDTCTLRMSRAFNYGGGLIPAHNPHMKTAAGGDKLRYGFRSREFDAYLRFAYGAPDIEVKGPPVPRERFLGKKGVISFDIRTFGPNPDGSRALGHVDLWDGKTFFDEIAGVSFPGRDFFAIASGVALWLIDGKVSLPTS
jgi:hypothetical protein